MDIIIYIVNLAFSLYYILLLIRLILSWLPHSPCQFPIDLLYRVTEPYLLIFRRALPPSSIGIDFSPIIALILLMVLQKIIVRALLLAY